MAGRHTYGSRFKRMKVVETCKKTGKQTVKSFSEETGKWVVESVRHVSVKIVEEL